MEASVRSGYELVIGASNQLSIANDMSWAVAGGFTGVVDTSAKIFGAVPNNSDSDPYVSYTFSIDGGGTNFAIESNAGLGLYRSMSLGPTAVGPMGLSASISAATTSGFKNGVRYSATGWSSIYYSSTAVLSMGGNAFNARSPGWVYSGPCCVWNRVLSVAEHLAFYADPFCMIRS